jgi:hypothetical protein
VAIGKIALRAIVDGLKFILLMKLCIWFGFFISIFPSHQNLDFLYKNHFSLLNIL